MIPAFLHGRHAVYRVYCEDNTCLYVGQSISLENRMLNHASTSAWYPLAARVVITLHPSKEIALAVEKAEILHLRPRFNIKGRRPRREWTPADYAELLEVYRLTAPSISCPKPDEQAEKIRRHFLARYPDIARQVLEAMAS